MEKEFGYKFPVEVQAPNLNWGPVGKHEIYVWPAPTDKDKTASGSVKIMGASIPPEQRTDNFYFCLRTGTNVSGRAIAATNETAGAYCRVACLSKDLKFAISDWKKDHTIPVVVAGGDGRSSDATLLAECARAAKALFKLKIAECNEVKAIYVGPLGTIVELPEHYLLLPGPSIDPKCPPGGHSLTRKRFVDWPTESAKLLGDKWKDGRVRRGLPAAEFAAIALQDWDKNRDATAGAAGFKAHPLGLLIGLGEGDNR